MTGLVNLKAIKRGFCISLSFFMSAFPVFASSSETDISSEQDISNEQEAIEANVSYLFKGESLEDLIKKEHAKLEEEIKFYPNQNIKIICANRAGDIFDFYSRLLARCLEKKLGVKVTVENNSGANGAVAMEEFSLEPPTGYSLIVTNVVDIGLNYTNRVTPVNYNTYQPVAIFGKSDSMVLAVDFNTQADNLNELVNLSKSGRKPISLGIGKSDISFLFALATREKLQSQINFYDIADETEDRLEAIREGRLDGAVFYYEDIKDQIKQGTLRPISALGSSRIPELPFIPTATELGLQNFSIDNYAIIYAPKMTPKKILKKLNGIILDIVYNDLEFASELKKHNNLQPFALSINDTKSYVYRNYEMFLEYAQYLEHNR